jgi:hypothetical protein
VWLNVGAFSPFHIRLDVDGERVADPAVITALMEAVARSRGWSTDRLFNRRDHERDSAA